MATPAQNAQYLIDFWKAMALAEGQFRVLMAASDETVTGAYDYVARIVNAQKAMKELVAQATADPNVRLSVFAAQSLFENALLLEDGRLTGFLLSAAQSGHMDFHSMIPLGSGDRTFRPPRQIMLDMIYDAGTAGVFSIKDPSGLTSWLHSVNIAGKAINGAAKGDPNGGVRAALLKLVRDVAIPEELAKDLKAYRTFESVIELLPSSPLPRDTRVTIQALNAQADARVTKDLARLPDLGALPAFPTGEGVLAPTFPPALAWWRQPRFWIAGAGGVVVGGLAAGQRRAR